MSLRSSRALCVCLWLLLTAAALLRAETPARVPVRITPALGQLARTSAYVFSGTVMSVERTNPLSSGSIAAVKITFHIDFGIQGVQTGQVLTVKEWAGLWNSGERYRPGERLVLFLHRPSALGLTSPVGGTLGRYTVEPGGLIVIDPAKIDPTTVEPAKIDPTKTNGIVPVPRGSVPVRTPARVTAPEFVRAIRSAEIE